MSGGRTFGFISANQVIQVNEKLELSALSYDVVPNKVSFKSLNIILDPDISILAPTAISPGVLIIGTSVGFRLILLMSIISTLIGHNTSP